MFISINAENSFYKIQFPFIIKILIKKGTEGNFLNLVMGICTNLKLTLYFIVKD